MRPQIEIVIPAEAETAELEQVCRAIAAHTERYRLHLIIRPDLNVSEARQLAMDSLPGRLICFMDSDAHQLFDGWLDEMHFVLASAPGAGAVYAGERWGSEPSPRVVTADPLRPWQEVPYGPAACMLIDPARISGAIRWTVPLGLANGWLGGDFEEVEYATQLRASGLRLYRATNTLFHHCGGRSTHKAFGATDRCQVINAIRNLLAYQEEKGIPSSEFWRALKRVPCAPGDDLSFHPSVVSPLRTIFRDVVLANHLSYAPIFRRLGIID
jgi:hypothetical protein